MWNFLTFISGFNSCIARKHRIVSLRPHIIQFKTKLILKQVTPGSYVVRNSAPAPADGRGLAGRWREITGTGAILHIWAIFDCRESIECMKTRIKRVGLHCEARWNLSSTQDNTPHWFLNTRDSGICAPAPAIPRGRVWTGLYTCEYLLMILGFSFSTK